MTRLVTDAEADGIVLRYVKQKAATSFRHFNAAQLTSGAIAYATHLDKETVAEALKRLAGNQVDCVRCSYDFWVPTNDHGERIKRRVLEYDLVDYNYALYRFIVVVVLYVGLLYAVAHKWLVLTDPAALLIAGIVIAFVSVLVSRRFGPELYFVSERIRSVPYYRWYIGLFIILGSVLVIALTTGSVNTFVAITTLVLNLINVGVFVMQLRRR